MNDIRMKIQPGFNPIPSGPNNEKPVSKPVPAGKGFGDVLAHQLRQKEGIVFSKHAAERLQQRNIRLSPQELSRLDKGLDRAAQKGIRETLIMMDNRAFIASVQNKTACGG
ncbi:MAG: hypothetical protein D5S00_09130 [Tindallia sp. MSAO_Bac2]|nr:MAG: hypothetical protein D5S00_09130 [Tindallia sp. MSAO_Bac2]